MIIRPSTVMLLRLLGVTICLNIAGAYAGCPTVLPETCNCITRVQNFQEVTSVFCVGKRLTDIPQFVFQPNSTVNILDLRRNELTSIRDDAFVGLYGVEVLWLDQNQISTIASSAFRAFRNTLQAVHLNYNQLTQIPVDALKSLPNLQRLELRYNEIASLALLDFETQNELKHLDLQSNKISAIAEGQFSKFPNLELLSLGENKIAHLPPRAFAGIENLTSLSLADNLLPDLPLDTYTIFKRLQIFDFSRNKIERLDTNLFKQLAELRNIYGSGNNLLRIERGTFENLTGLTTLDLSNNKFQTLALDTFKGLDESLVSLNLMGNNLTETSVLPAIKSMAKLQRLLLSRNAFEVLDANAFQSLSSLKQIFLARNKIWRVNESAFAGLEGTLEVLHLEHNRLLKIPDLKNVTKLRKFYFGGNTIGEIPKGAFDGLKLTDLDLSETNITSKLASLPREAFHGLEEYLLNLDLRGNSLETIYHCVFGGLKELQILDISLNPLSCDCRMLWLRLSFTGVTYNRASCGRSANKGESWEDSSDVQSFEISGCTAKDTVSCVDPPDSMSTKSPPPGYTSGQSTADKDTIVIIVLACVCSVAFLAVVVGFVCSLSQRRKELKTDYKMSDTESSVYSISQL